MSEFAHAKAPQSTDDAVRRPSQHGATDGPITLPRTTQQRLALRPANLRGLQRAAGNAAVQRLVSPSAAAEAEAPKPIESGGEPLPTATRSSMEERFGVDFGDVRVHRGADAHASATEFGAKAYTSANNIVFSHGAYAPDTSSGERTLAHELAHVVQQSAGPVEGSDIGNGVAVSDPGDRHEREAEQTADEVLSSAPGPTGADSSESAADANVQRCGPGGCPDESQCVQREVGEVAAQGGGMVEMLAAGGIGGLGGLAAQGGGMAGMLGGGGIGGLGGLAAQGGGVAGMLSAGGIGGLAEQTGGLMGGGIGELAGQAGGLPGLNPLGGLPDLTGLGGVPGQIGGIVDRARATTNGVIDTGVNTAERAVNWGMDQATAAGQWAGGKAGEVADWGRSLL